MKLIYDVIGAAPGSGGVEVHAREFIHAWTQRYPGEEVVIVGSKWDGLSDDFTSRVRWINWPSRLFVSRVIGQLVFIPALARLRTTHVLLVSLPVLSPMSPRRRSFVFSHDWRHVKNPQEFSFPRRVYRSIWRSSANRAAMTFCISAKALTETSEIAPRSVLVLAENGRDHALRWTAGPLDSPVLTALPPDSPVVVTFGHFNNKRPELVISALATLPEGSALQLIVLGARGRYRDELRALASALDLSAQVHFPGFVEDNEYQAIMKRADCVVLASSDEGFGLPVAEALALGRPVVVTTDGGMEQTFGDAVQAVPADPGQLGRAINDAVTGHGPTPLEWTAGSWSDTATVVHEAIASTLRQPSRTRRGRSASPHTHIAPQDASVGRRLHATRGQGEIGSMTLLKTVLRHARDAARKSRKLTRLAREPQWRRGLRSSVAATVEFDALPLRHDLRTVVDVGGNRGQFSLYSLSRFPAASIISFEPLESAAAHMSQLFTDEKRVEILRFALGDEPGEAAMHVSAREDSSSLLPVGERQVSTFPGTEEVGTAPTEVQTLDNVLEGRDLMRPALLKIDVQGFELAVLRGAERSLRSFDQVLVEASFVELYVGQALFADVHDYLEAFGFRLVSGLITSSDHAGRWLQGDFLYQSE